MRILNENFVTRANICCDGAACDVFHSVHVTFDITGLLKFA